MAPTETRQWILSNKPTAEPDLSNSDKATFKVVTKPLPELQPNQLLVKTLYLSNDPAQRSWIGANVDPARLYTTPVNTGEVMRSYGIGEVVSSTTDNIPVGTLVNASTDWSEYNVLPSNQVRPIEQFPGLSPAHFVGAFGGPGTTAYYGFVEIGRASPEDTVVVSGAAGATGSMVVQLAKHVIGCKRVIGIAGSDEKCRWVESLGADTCINYKSSTFKDDLIKATDGFVEVYFDNVGGEILDLMLTRVKRFGRILACGSVSTYNGDKSGLKNWTEIITNRLEVRGFIVLDAFAAGKGAKFVGELVKGFKEGKIKVGEENQTVVDTKFEDIPKTWSLLFSGGNQGKLITKLV